MKLNFRQGIQIAPMTSGQPSFLNYNPGNNTITIAVGVDLIRATAAWKNVNYLIEERETIVDAWGPFPLSNTTYYLYWDINLSTGAVTRGITIFHPEINAFAPLNPNLDQHWFDTVNKVMKVWNGVNWVQKIRVFAATFISGSYVIEEYPLGSQVGISVSGAQDTWFDHGYILYGIDQKAIKNSDGSMVTTAIPINTYHGSFSSPIRLELSNSTALAKEPIAAFCAISACGDGSVQLASGTNPEKRPIGITTFPVIAGEPVDIVFKGIVYNDQWEWDYTLGKDLYCGNTGIPFQNNGSFTAATRIGAILDTRTVLIDIDLYGTAIGGDGGISWPLLAPSEYNSPNNIIPFSFEDSQATGAQMEKGVDIPYNPSWVAIYGEDNEYNHAESVVFDSFGNSYTVGVSTDKLAFIVKYNEIGEVVWQKKFTGTLTFENIAIDSSDNIYVCGSLETTDYYGTSYSSYLLKLTIDGTLIWQKQIDIIDSSQQFSKGITVDTLGNVIVIGSFSINDYYSSFDAIYVYKATSDGAIIWSNYIKGNNLSFLTVDCKPSSVCTDTANNIYITGAVTEHYNDIGFVIKLTSDGNKVWNTVLHNSDLVNSRYFDINTDSFGNIYLTGEHALNDSYYGSITKLDPLGNQIWAQQISNVSYYGITVDQSGVYVAGNQNEGIVVAKFSLIGTPEWQRMLVSQDNTRTKQVYNHNFSGTNTITLYNDRIVIVGYNLIGEHSRVLIAQFQTDGTKTAEYGPFDRNGYKTFFEYSSSEIKNTEFTWNVTTDIVINIEPLTIENSDGTLLINKNNFNSIKFPKPSIEITADKLILSRENNDSLALTAFQGGEVVKVNSELHGLQITPGAANAETHDTLYDDQELAGTLRTINGQIQTKVELNVGFNKDLYVVDGAVGYQAITPYQTQIHGPSSLNPYSPLTIDFSAGKSVMWLVDPLNDYTEILPTGGLAGESYELFYKLANPVPGYSAMYPYNQYSNVYSSEYNGMTGPLIVVASEGLREVCVISRMNNRVFHTALNTGLPREIAISNNKSRIDTAYDTALVSTTNGYIEMLKSSGNDDCRIYGVNRAEVLNLTSSINSDNNMDGYIWMDQNNNWLYAVGLSGDIWYIDSTSPDPFETGHNVMPIGTKVLSIGGDSTANSVFGLLYILYTLNGDLKLRTIDLNTNTPYDLVLVTNFTGTANDLIIDPTMQRVYITTSDGIHIHFIAVDTSTLTAIGIINDQLIPLSKSYFHNLRKCVGTIRSSSNSVYIPHIKEIIIVNYLTFDVSTVDMNEYFIHVDRLVLDNVRDLIVGTNNHHEPVDNLSNTVGVIIIDNLNVINDYLEQINYGFTSIGWYGIPPNSTVASYSDLSNEPEGHVILALDTGIYWISNGLGGYCSINEYVNYSNTYSTYDYDCLTLIPSNDLSNYTDVSVMPEIQTYFNNNDYIRFPDFGIMFGDYNLANNLPVPDNWNQIWIAKLSKAAFFDDKNHDQYFHWYCTGIIGPYTYPKPLLP